VKAAVVVPTYNESENVGPLLEAIAALAVPGLEVIVVDDASPDGTAGRVRAFAREHPFAHVIERRGPKGRGYAGREGFLAALERGADLVVEMDGDLSHDPRYIPRLLAAAQTHDVALGSRFVHGGRDTERALWRRVLTIAANFYIRLVFGTSVRDANSGFRCFSRRALEAIDVKSLRSPGPAIVQEVLFRAHRKGLRIAEIPVRFAERARGDSKLGWPQLWQSYWIVLRLRLRQILGREP
jgi:dolichol-phosphate mannosyltransferase